MIIRIWCRQFLGVRMGCVGQRRIGLGGSEVIKISFFLVEDKVESPSFFR